MATTLTRSQFEAHLDQFLAWLVTRIRTNHHYRRNGHVYISSTAKDHTIECAIVYDDVWMVPRCYFRRFDGDGHFITESPVPPAMLEIPPQLGTTWWCLHPCSTTETLQEHLGSNEDVIAYLKYWFELYGVHHIYTDIDTYNNHN